MGLSGALRPHRADTKKGEFLGNGGFSGKALSILLMDVEEASSCGILDSDTGQNPPLGCQASQHLKARALGGTPPDSPCPRCADGLWRADGYGGWGVTTQQQGCVLKSILEISGQGKNPSKIFKLLPFNTETGVLWEFDYRE